AKIRAIQPATMKLPSTRVLNVVAASLRRGVQAALLPRTRRHSAMATALIIFAALIAAPIERAVGAAVSGQSGDPGWPREKYSNGNRLIIYQPQVDDWEKLPGPELAHGGVDYTQKWKNSPRCRGDEREYGHRQRCQGGHYHESAGHRHLFSILGQSHSGKDGAIV